MPSTNQQLILTSGAAGLAPEIEAFLLVAGAPVNPLVIPALQYLLSELKSADLWDDCFAIYPLVGGTAQSHSTNFKNPASNFITWVGGVTHNDNGVTGNGTTGYGDTGINCLSSLIPNNNHLAVYSRTAASASHMEIGASGGAASQFYFGCRFSNLAYSVNGGNTSEIAIAEAVGQGFFIASRRSATDSELYKNGVSIGNDVDNQGAWAMPNRNVYVNGINNAGTPQFLSTKNTAFYSIGIAGLDDSKALAYSNIVETFQDMLGRGVM